MNLPKRLYRVTWDAAVGWPHPERRQTTARNYATAENAGRQIASIRNLPSHLKLVSVCVTDCEWTEIDPDTLPIPDVETEE